MPPIDASIPMGVVGGASGPASAGHSGSNPLALITNLTELQKSQNELKVSNASLVARRKFGQIMAASPDMDSAVATAFADPDVSAFASELTANAASTRNAILDASGKLGTQGQDAFHTFVKGMPAAIKDPSLYPTLKATALSLASPAIRPMLAKSIDLFDQSLNADLDPDPAKAQEQKRQRFIGWANANDAGEAVKNIVSTPDQIPLGNVVQPILRGAALGSEPGKVTPVGNSLAIGISPTLANPGSVPYKDGSGGGANSLAIPAPKPAASAPADAPPAPSAIPAANQSALGVPLFDPATDLAEAPATAVRDLAGNPTGLEGGRSAALMKDFTEKGKDRYDGAINLKGQLAQIDHDLTGMAKGGGWLVPGSGADLRLSLGKLKSTVQTATGSAPDIDTQKVALGENFNKVVQQMAGSLLNNMYGQQREAAETIKNITDKGVPGISNSLMGGKMITSMFGAVADRSIDKYRFDTEWAAHRNGDLRGSDVAFDKKFPAKLYIDKALHDIGMNETGFTSLRSLKAAKEAGLFTQEQYEAILANEGKIPADLPKVKAETGKGK